MPDSPRGLYVHIPFCSVKCFYCDFTAFAGQRAQTRRYLKALDAEAALRLGRETSARTAREAVLREQRSGAPPKTSFGDSCARMAFPRAPVQTLYVGGGTPSELSADELSELLRIVESCYGPVAGMAEATLEANPESVTLEKLQVLARGGMRRLSLGLQTAEPRLLAEIGRRHSLGDFFAAMSAARGLGFAVSIDLMYGLPTQTLAEVLASLDTVLSLEPEHISLYGLQVEDRTLFARRGVEPDEDLGREMFERSLDRLAAAGYRHYEISNFARPGFESIHNRIYWRDGEYVGLGCGASGFLDGVRYSNHDRLGAYCDALERGQLPTGEQESLTGREKLGETLMLGFRLIDGIPLPPEAVDVFAQELRHIQDCGWVTIEDGRARLTREGVFLANRVFEEFVPPFRDAAICLTPFRG